jgi:hypothetical protein
MNSLSPDAGDVFRFDRLGKFDDLAWVALGRHRRNPSLIFLAACVRNTESDSRNSVRDAAGDLWTLYPEVQLCVHQADLEETDVVPSLKLDLTEFQSKAARHDLRQEKGSYSGAPISLQLGVPSLGFIVGESNPYPAEIEHDERLDRLVQARDAIEHRLHFGLEPDTSKPSIKDCSLTSIDPENREMQFHWQMDPNREYRVHATTSGVIKLQQTYRAVDVTQTDLMLPLSVGTENIEFDEAGAKVISPALAQIIEKQFGHPGLITEKPASDRHEKGRQTRVSPVFTFFGRPWFAPAALAALVILVVSLSNYWSSSDGDMADYVVVSASVQGANAAAAAGFRGADATGGDIFAVRLASMAAGKTADYLTDEMRNLNAIVTRRAISQSHINLMVAMPSNEKDAINVMRLFGQSDHPPSALLLVEVVRDAAKDRP